MPNSTPKDKLIHIPIFDLMRDDLIRTNTFDRSMDGQEFAKVLNGSLDSYLAQNPGISVAKDLKIELEDKQACVSGNVQASAMGANIDIRIIEYSLNQKETGRLGVIDLKYDLKYRGNILTDLKVNETQLRKDFEAALRDPNTFIWKGLSSQLPAGVKVIKFALSLEDSKFKIHLESQKN